MSGRAMCLWAACAVMAAGAAARAEVRPAVARNANASPDFKLENVPPPVKNDAAAKAKITVVDGTRDRNGGEAAVLNDGFIPRADDEPRSNFFFASGTEGGRLLIDLGAAVDVKQVNTYSWHPGSRGPQVYKLYGADGSAEGFDPQTKRGTEPDRAGWKLIASVDSRPQAAESGGQYGVSVADPAGPALGKFRYLLLDIAPTQKG